MSYPIEQKRKVYTYKDYLDLPDNSYEIIEGILYMTPAPSIQHQRVSRKLLIRIGNYLEGKTCEIFDSPCDVLLSDNSEQVDEDIKVVVQPDLFVVCDKTKITGRYCVGSPDWIMEIVSPANPSRDYVKKLNIYEKYKVKEYWIVNYTRKEILVYKLLENGEYGEPEMYKDSEIKVSIFEDLKIKLKDIFE